MKPLAEHHKVSFRHLSNSGINESSTEFIAASKVLRFQWWCYLFALKLPFYEILFTNSRINNTVATSTFIQSIQSYCHSYTVVVIYIVYVKKRNKIMV